MGVDRRLFFAVGGIILMGNYLVPENPVVGGTVLRRAAIQSPDFLTGSKGWQINQNGSAEFNNVTVRGTILTVGTTTVKIDPTTGQIVISDSASKLTATMSEGQFSLANGNTGDLALLQLAANGLNDWMIPHAILPQDPNSPGNPEVWHALGTLTGSGYTGNHARYRMTVEGAVEFDIDETAGAPVVAGTYTFANTLNAAYRPAINRLVQMADNPAGAPTVVPRLFVGTTGTVQAIVNAATHFGGDGKMRLD